MSTGKLGNASYIGQQPIAEEGDEHIERTIRLDSLLIVYLGQAGTEVAL